MKDVQLKIDMKFAQLDELDEMDRMLVEKAIYATNHSYAKYSHFCVGSALLLEDGQVILGANQENAVYTVGLCAERTALFAAQAQFPDVAHVAIAIAARNENGLVKSPVSPCGSCRQVMVEVEERFKRNLRILLYGTNGVYIVNSVKDLMPLTFVDESMR